MPESMWWIPVACALAAVACRDFVAGPSRLLHARPDWCKLARSSTSSESGLKSNSCSGRNPGQQADSPAAWSRLLIDDAVSYVRHRTTGELSAFVAVTVALEGMGALNATASDLIGNLQAGTAVFRFDKRRWVTDGRVIHNLSPNEAIRYYQSDLEMVGQEMADRSV